MNKYEEKSRIAEAILEYRVFSGDQITFVISLCTWASGINSHEPIAASVDAKIEITYNEKISISRSSDM